MMMITQMMIMIKSINTYSYSMQADRRAEKLSKNDWGDDQPQLLPSLPPLSLSDPNNHLCHHFANYHYHVKVLTYEMGILVWDPEGEIIVAP